MFRSPRKLTAWIAILAMALNALWPLVAQARPAQKPDLHELCTAAGIQYVAVAGEVPAGQKSGTAMPHCAFCSLGADRVAIAPLVQIGVAHDRDVREAVPHGLDAPLPESFSRSSAQPRAPPFLS